MGGRQRATTTTTVAHLAATNGKKGGSDQNPQGPRPNKQSDTKARANQVRLKTYKKSLETSDVEGGDLVPLPNICTALEKLI